MDEIRKNSPISGRKTIKKIVFPPEPGSKVQGNPSWEGGPGRTPAPHSGHPGERVETWKGLPCREIPWHMLNLLIQMKDKDFIPLEGIKEFYWSGSRTCKWWAGQKYFSFMKVDS
uniref:Uncharacterized protein n=1 Tax=Micrurus lemniscatus lemniscatus TaxID=129467 RepID=A0A2D4IML5_MICLE